MPSVATLRPGRHAPERVAVIPPVWAAENTGIRKKATPKPWAKIEDLYRQLKRNYEEQRDYERAGDFHYGEKEMRRRNPETSFGLKCLLHLYKYASGYGERWLPPLLWSLALLLAGAAAYLYFALWVKDGNYLLYCWNWQSASDGVPGWIRSLLFSLRVMTLLKPDDMVPLGWGSVVQTVQSLLGPILLGLAALAIRQKKHPEGQCMISRRLLTLGPDNEPLWVRLYLQEIDGVETGMMVREGEPPPSPGSLRGVCFFGKTPEEAKAATLSLYGRIESGN